MWWGEGARINVGGITDRLDSGGRAEVGGGQKNVTPAHQLSCERKCGVLIELLLSASRQVLEF